VLGLSDLDGDGFGDLVVTADNESASDQLENSGAAHVFSGRTLERLYSLFALNEQEDAFFGQAGLASPGDVNGDGAPDILVSAIQENYSGLDDPGRVYLYSGKNGRPIHTFTPLAPSPDSNKFGYRIMASSSVLDLPALPHIAIGEDPDDSQNADLHVYSRDSFQYLYSLLPTGNQEFDKFPNNILAFPDVTNDGVLEIVVSSLEGGTGSEANRAGKVYVFSGSDGNLLTEFDSPNPQPDAEFGDWLGVVPDVSGDGQAELLVAAPDELNGVTETSEGRLYIVPLEFDAPSIKSFEALNTSPSRASELTFGLTFSERITGLDVNDFEVLTGGTLNNAQLQSISGDRAEFTISVDSGQGDGDLWIELNGSGSGIVDFAGNEMIAQASSPRVYLDRTAPEIDLIGDSLVVVPYAGSYIDAGATASDSFDGVLTSSIDVAGLPIDTLVPGEQVVTYQVRDSAGNNASVDRTVVVLKDVIPGGEGEGAGESGGEGEGVGGPEGEAGGDGEAEGGVEGEGEDGTGPGEGEDMPEGEAEPGTGGEAEPATDGEAEPQTDGEAEPQTDGEAEPSTDGEAEPTPDGEAEPTPDGEAEPTPDGEAESGGEDGEAEPAEGEDAGGTHDADGNGDGIVNLSELLRVIQLYNAGGYACADGEGETPDGYAAGGGGTPVGAPGCTAHDADFMGGDGVITLSELLRGIQLFSFAEIEPCPGESEDGFCAAPV